MKKSCFTNITLVLAAVFCFSLISAPSTSHAADVKYRLGVGAAMVPDYEGSEDTTVVPGILFSAVWDEGYFIKTAGTALRANVLADKMWSVGPALQYRMTRDDDVDNTAVSRMQKIDSTVEGGIFAGFNNAGKDASIQWVTDLSDEHDGSLITLAAGYRIKKGDYKIRGGVSTTYADDDYMDTYFSVNAANVGTSGLPFYKAEAGVKDIGVDLTVSSGISDNWDLSGTLGVKSLLGDAKDSPVVDQEGDSTQLSLAIMAIYNF